PTSCSFFFQAEDGIRDLTVTGVQTCALPIFAFVGPFSLITLALTIGFVNVTSNPFGGAAVQGAVAVTAALTFALAIETAQSWVRSEERRVGKSVDGGWWCGCMRAEY